MSEQQLHTGHRLILMQQKTATYRGLGFIIGPRLLDHVLSFANISDRVAFIDLSLPLKNSATTKCRVINVYGPTAERVKEDPNLVDTLYDELSSVITIPARWQLFICGDFNSKLAKLSQEDRDAGLWMCMGSCGSGKRNANGETLAAFMCSHGLFATTSLQAPMPTSNYMDWTHRRPQGLTWIKGNKSNLQPDRLCVVQSRSKTTTSELTLLWGYRS